MIQQELLPRSLRYCLLATKVGAILDNYQEPISLTPREKSTLEAAKEFILSAVEGRRATQALEISEKALEASGAYGEAIEATAQLIRQGVKIPKEVDRVFKDLVSTLDALQQTGDAPKDNIALARDFFRVLREITLVHGAGMIEQVTLWEK